MKINIKQSLTFLSKNNKWTKQNSPIVCGESGQWVGEVPECKPVVCSSEPNDIPNVRTMILEGPYEPILEEPIPYRYNEELSVFCESGFKRFFQVCLLVKIAFSFVFIVRNCIYLFLYYIVSLVQVSLNILKLYNVRLER